jgi:hypothetical protein
MRVLVTGGPGLSARTWPSTSSPGAARWPSLTTCRPASARTCRVAPPSTRWTSGTDAAWRAFSGSSGTGQRPCPRKRRRAPRGLQHRQGGRGERQRSLRAAGADLRKEPSAGARAGQAGRAAAQLRGSHARRVSPGVEARGGSRGGARKDCEIFSSPIVALMYSLVYKDAGSLKTRIGRACGFQARLLKETDLFSDQ